MPSWTSRFMLALHLAALGVTIFPVSPWSALVDKMPYKEGLRWRTDSRLPAPIPSGGLSVGGTGVGQLLCYFKSQLL